MFKKFLNGVDEVDFVSYFLSLAFISAGLSKILNFDFFRLELVSMSKLFEFFALPVIVSEVWIGVGLIFRGSRLVSMFFGLIMLFLFTVFVLYRYITGSSSGCGCGVFFINWRTDLIHIVLNFILIILPFFVLINSNKRREVK